MKIFIALPFKLSMILIEFVNLMLIKIANLNG